MSAGSATGQRSARRVPRRRRGPAGSATVQDSGQREVVVAGVAVDGAVIALPILVGQALEKGGTLS